MSDSDLSLELIDGRDMMYHRNICKAESLGCSAIQRYSRDTIPSAHHKRGTEFLVRSSSNMSYVVYQTYRVRSMLCFGTSNSRITAM